MEHNGCAKCQYENLQAEDEPCANCRMAHHGADKESYTDFWTPKQKHDSINHPEHYCQSGGIECIDEMLEVFGRNIVKDFCLCNVWKYRKRAVFKNGEEDMKKADWYMKKYLELKKERRNRLSE